MQTNQRTTIHETYRKKNRKEGEFTQKNMGGQCMKKLKLDKGDIPYKGKVTESWSASLSTSHKQ